MEMATMVGSMARVSGARITWSAITRTMRGAFHHRSRFAPRSLIVPMERAERLSLLPLALPFEHGAWGFLLEPIVLGLLVAPSRGGVLIAVAIVAAFLVRHPLRLAIGDRMRGRTYRRTRVCALFAFGFAATAAASLVSAVFVSGTPPLLPLLGAMPLLAANFIFEVRHHGRWLAVELMGAVAAGAAASAIALAARQPLAVALTLWLLMAARAIPSILYVRASLGRGSRAVMLVAHAVAAIVALAAGRGVAAMLVLLARAALAHPRRARDLGIREVFYGAVTVALIAMF
jgi:hypothetical protein